MNTSLPNRQSIRLKNYDYSQPGYYFITLCTQNYKHLFGDIIGDDPQLSPIGEILQTQWFETQNRFPDIHLDEFIVMPNHIHGIIAVGPPLAGARPQTQDKATIKRTQGHDKATIKHTQTQDRPLAIGDIIGGYKSLSVHHCLKWIKTNHSKKRLGKIWQRNYWEHIVRNEDELHHIRQYIKDNPLKWEHDKLNGGIGNMIRESPEPYGEESWMM